MSIKQKTIESYQILSNRMAKRHTAFLYTKLNNCIMEEKTLFSIAIFRNTLASMYSTRNSKIYCSISLFTLRIRGRWVFYPNSLLPFSLEAPPNWYILPTMPPKLLLSRLSVNFIDEIS